MTYSFEQFAIPKSVNSRMEQARSKEIDLFGDALRFDALDCALREQAINTSVIDEELAKIEATKNAALGFVKRESNLLTQQIRQAVGASSFNESPIKAFTIAEILNRAAKIHAQMIAVLQSLVTRLDDEPSLLNTHEQTPPLQQRRIFLRWFNFQKDSLAVTNS